MKMLLKYMFKDIALVWSGFVPSSPQLTCVTMSKGLWVSTARKECSVKFCKIQQDGVYHPGIIGILKQLTVFLEILHNI